MADHPSDHDGTGQGLLEFLEYAASKGLLNKNTAGAMRTTASQVIEVENADPTQVDVRSIDPEDLFSRFEKLNKQKFSPGSLQTYKSRFQNALKMYDAYLANPRTWRPETRRLGASSSAERSRGSSAAKAQAPPPRVADEMVEYPFPVRDGMLARLELPRDLRKAEAQRLGSFLMSLAIDEPQALPAGSTE